jgi:hypothetical protein
MKELSAEEQVKLNPKLKLIKNEYNSQCAFIYNNKKYYIYLFSNKIKEHYILRQSPKQSKIQFIFDILDQAIDKLDDLLKFQLHAQDELKKELEKENRKVVFIRKFNKNLDSNYFDNKFEYNNKIYLLKFSNQSNNVYYCVQQNVSGPRNFNSTFSTINNNFSSILDLIDKRDIEIKEKKKEICKLIFKTFQKV